MGNGELTYIPLASKHSSARNLKSNVSSPSSARHRKGLTQLLRWQGLAGSFTGKLDHISAHTAQQHLHHGEPDTLLYNKNSECSITSTPQAPGSTVCLLNLHWL